MKKTKSFQKKPEKLLGNEREGLLIALFGASAEVEDENGQIIRCQIRKNLEPVITGDRVLWQPAKDDTGIIVDYLPRKSLLGRPEPSGKIKPLAANIDAIIIVTAPPPAISEYLIDRYIIAAESLNIMPIILLNKMDLLTDATREDIKQRLEVYKKLGYPVISSSVYVKDGLVELENFLQTKTCVLVGISGVGKSSIISNFIPDQIVKVGDVSAKGTGKHTTTMTRLYHLPTGGNLIDSPGVREFSLWHMSKDQIMRGFIELREISNHCKFRNCHHMSEPGCAVQVAVEKGEVSAERLKNFREIISSL